MVEAPSTADIWHALGLNLSTPIRHELRVGSASSADDVRRELRMQNSIPEVAQVLRNDVDEGDEVMGTSYSHVREDTVTSQVCTFAKQLLNSEGAWNLLSIHIFWYEII